MGILLFMPLPFDSSPVIRCILGYLLCIQCFVVGLTTLFLQLDTILNSGYRQPNLTALYCAPCDSSTPHTKYYGGCAGGTLFSTFASFDWSSCCHWSTSVCPEAHAESRLLFGSNEVYSDGDWGNMSCRSGLKLARLGPWCLIRAGHQWQYVLQLCLKSSLLAWVH